MTQGAPVGSPTRAAQMATAAADSLVVPSHSGAPNTRPGRASAR